MKLSKAAVVALVLATAACGGGDDDTERADGGDGGITTPTFEEEDRTAPTTSTSGAGGTSSTSPDGASSSTTPGGGPGEATPTATASGSAASANRRVAFDDPVGDATSGQTVGTPPSWSDLAGGSLEREGDAYRLTIRLGGAAPQTAPGAETMNIATFFDTDGDGAVERELWVNLGANGWGPVWYDDKGNAAAGERSNVTVVVEGDEVRLLFPDVMLEKPDRLRFSMASEYGPLTVIGTDQARRDDAPNDDRVVSFP